MKALIITLLTLVSFQAQAVLTEVQIVSSHLGVEDQLQQKSLCLTIFRLPHDGSQFGLVESLYDCFYGRKAAKTKRLKIDLSLLSPLEDETLFWHLQKNLAPLEFYTSSGE